MAHEPKQCKICGKEFEPIGKQLYCGEKCAAEASHRQRKKYNQTHRAKQLAEQKKTYTGVYNDRLQITPSRCGEIEADMRSEGKRYAEWQKADTLKRVGGIICAK